MIKTAGSHFSLKCLFSSPDLCKNDSYIKLLYRFDQRCQKLDVFSRNDVIGTLLGKHSVRGLNTDILLQHFKLDNLDQS